MLPSQDVRPAAAIEANATGERAYGIQPEYEIKARAADIQTAGMKARG